MKRPVSQAESLIERENALAVIPRLCVLHIVSRSANESVCRNFNAEKDGITITEQGRWRGRRRFVGRCSAANASTGPATAFQTCARSTTFWQCVTRRRDRARNSHCIRVRVVHGGIQQQHERQGKFATEQRICSTNHQTSRTTKGGIRHWHVVTPPTTRRGRHLVVSMEPVHAQVRTTTDTAGTD